MSWYYVLYQAIRILLVVLLFVLPLAYCLIKGNFKKGFWLTWIVWSVVVFLFGILLPALAILREKATGEHSDIMCGGFVLGIFYTIATFTIGTLLGPPNPNPVYVVLGALIFVLIVYAIVGFILGAIFASVYNVIASRFGGIEIDLK